MAVDVRAAGSFQAESLSIGIVAFFLLGTF